MAKLKIIPLGGLGEIGKNLTVYEYGQDIVVVDCGLGFPDEELYGVRGERLYEIDRSCQLRFSHENPEVQLLYREFLGEPLSHRSEELLHTDHRAWDMPK